MTIDTALGITGIVLALALYYFDLKKKLDVLQHKLGEVLELNEGVLTKQQAHDLIDLYLDAVESHVALSFAHYAKNDLPKHYNSKNFDAMRLELERAYDQIVQKSIRKMVSSFLLRGHHTVDELIRNVSQEPVSLSLTSMIEAFSEARNVDTPLEDALPRVLRIARETNAAGKKLILEAVDKHYPSRSTQNNNKRLR